MGYKGNRLKTQLGSCIRLEGLWRRVGGRRKDWSDQEVGGERKNWNSRSKSCRRRKIIPRNIKELETRESRPGIRHRHCWLCKKIFYVSGRAEPGRGSYTAKPWHKAATTSPRLPLRCTVARAGSRVDRRGGSSMETGCQSKHRSTITLSLIARHHSGWQYHYQGR